MLKVDGKGTQKMYKVDRKRDMEMYKVDGKRALKSGVQTCSENVQNGLANVP